MDGILVNKVAASGLITLNMEDWYPESKLIELDLKEFLFHGLLLKEKEFRQSVKEKDWSEFEDAVLCMHCSTDAIIPVWAFMLIAVAAEPFCKEVHWGTKHSYLQSYYKNKIEQLDIQTYEGQKLVIKGCSKKEVPASAYMDIAHKLKPVAQSIMYGEPCSTVPVYKKPKN